jgi:hypothetical protein
LSWQNKNMCYNTSLNEWCIFICTLYVA